MVDGASSAAVSTVGRTDLGRAVSRSVLPHRGRSYALAAAVRLGTVRQGRGRKAVWQRHAPVQPRIVEGRRQPLRVRDPKVCLCT